EYQSVIASGTIIQTRSRMTAGAIMKRARVRVCLVAMGSPAELIIVAEAAAQPPPLRPFGPPLPLPGGEERRCSYAGASPAWVPLPRAGEEVARRAGVEVIPPAGRSTSAISRPGWPPGRSRTAEAPGGSLLDVAGARHLA